MEINMIIVFVGALAAIGYLIFYYERRLNRLRRKLQKIQDQKQNKTDTPPKSRLKAAQIARAARTSKKEKKKKRVLEALHQNGRSSHEELRQTLEFPAPTLSRYLAELEQEGRVKKESQGVNSYWEFLE